MKFRKKLFILFLNDPFRVLQIRPLKRTYTDNSRAVRNFWIVVEQEMYSTGIYFCYKQQSIQTKDLSLFKHFPKL